MDTNFLLTVQRQSTYFWIFWYYSLAHSQKVASEIMFQYLHCEHTAGFKGKWTNPTSFPFFSMCLKSFGALKEIDQNSLVPFWFSSLVLERETGWDCRILLNFLLKQTLSQFCSQLHTHRSSLLMHVLKCNTSPSWLKHIKTTKGRQNTK